MTPTVTQPIQRAAKPDVQQCNGAHERPYVLFPIGYPVEGCQVRRLLRKGLDDVLTVR